MRPATLPSLRALTLLIVTAALAWGCGVSEPPPGSEPAAESAAVEETRIATPAEDAPLTSGDSAALSPEASLSPAELELAHREAEVAEREAELAARARELAAAERRARQAPPPPRQEPAPAPAPPAPEPEPVVAETAPPAPPPEPEPAPEPPRTIALTVPEGTIVEVELLEGVSSAESSVGDRFASRVVQDVVVDGLIAIPAGSRVMGTVTEVQPLRAVGGQARLGLSFDRLEPAGGEPVAIRGGLASAGRSETRRDAATIGGATAGGALLGRVISGRGDRKKNTVIGALVGAAVGTAIASRTAGEEVEVPAGTVLDLYLEDRVRLVIEE